MRYTGYSFLKRRRLIEKIVNDCLDANFIDIMSFANNLGIKILSDDDAHILNGALGRYFIDIDRDLAIIVIDTHLPNDVKRYVLAHELGHHLLDHKKVDRIMVRDDDRIFLEWEADLFATLLLGVNNE